MSAGAGVRPTSDVTLADDDVPSRRRPRWSFRARRGAAPQGASGPLRQMLSTVRAAVRPTAPTTTSTATPTTGPTAVADEEPADTGRRAPLRRRTVVTAGVAVVIVAVAATWLIAFSSVFGVRTIVVRGTDLLSQAQVRSAAAVSAGTPLVRVDAAAVRARVERLALVANVQVETSFPHTVVITVTERRPVGYLRAGQADVLVDRTGKRYRTVREAPRDLPHLVLPAGRGPSAVGRSVAQVAVSLPASLRARVRSIQALDPTAITLVLRDGRLVHWGGATRDEDKARVLGPLLRRHVAQVDVSDPDHPYTR